MEVTPASDQDRLATAEAALEEALRERNLLWEQLNRQRADQRELDYLRAELRAVHSSPLWRLADTLRRR